MERGETGEILHTGLTTSKWVRGVLYWNLLYKVIRLLQDVAQPWRTMEKWVLGEGRLKQHRDFAKPTLLLDKLSSSRRVRCQAGYHVLDKPF